MPDKAPRYGVKSAITDTSVWRLVKHQLLDGVTNMSFDEAILEAVAAGESPPTLRFYGWKPACLSLGYGQIWQIADLDRLSEQGWDMVRRPTGGRAILHVDELTYSVCAPIQEPRVRGSVLESYQRLSEALLAGLRAMGLFPAKAVPDPEKPPTDGPACFDGPSNYEIAVDGKKLVGSAQVRKRGVVLQHGTLPLFGDVGRITRVLQLPNEDERAELAEKLHFQAATLESVLGYEPSLQDVIPYMVAGFCQTLNLEFEESQLTSDELEAAAVLRIEKYANDAWTKRL